MISAILYIGIAQCLFAAILVLTKKKKFPPDKVLLAWLLTIAFKFLLFLLNEEHKEFFNIQFSAGLIPLTFGPFLYLYTKFLTNEEAKLRAKHFLHFGPFLVLTILYFFVFGGSLSFDESVFLNHDHLLWARIIYAISYFTSILIYTIFTFTILKNYRKQIRDTLSYETGKSKLFWLNYIALLFGTTFLIYFIVGGINAVSFKHVIESNIVSSIGLTLLAFSVSYFGLRQPTIFRIDNIKNEDNTILNAGLSTEDNYIDTRIHRVGQMMSKQDPPQNDNSIMPSTEKGIIEEERYKKSGLKEEEIKVIIGNLQKYMIEERPYLIAELTIQDLSTALNINKHHLTQVLNNNIGKNFFNYINEYRIEAVKKKIADKKFAHLTLLAIAYDCGFNSKSSFNNIFKQYTGVTPSEYKKELQENEMNAESNT
jgi:AraC-like DNA-binding protein